MFYYVRSGNGKPLFSNTIGLIDVTLIEFAEESVVNGPIVSAGYRRAPDPAGAARVSRKHP